MSEGRSLFVVHVAGDDAPDALDVGDARTLRPGLYLIDAEATQSRVYHAVKRTLPKDTPLFVARTAEQPKFKGMSAGATKWTRLHAG